MNAEQLRQLLAAVAHGERSVDDAIARLTNLPFEDLGFAKVDHHRSLRCGAGEVVFGAGKTDEQIARIVAALVDGGSDVLVTRIADSAAALLQQQFANAKHDEVSRTVRLCRDDAALTGHVAIVCAGTSDLPIAEEARVTATFLGAKTTTHYDCGVAGIHRLMEQLPTVRGANAIVVAAGMEGALPSVVAGLVDRPVIGVPTSVGYGANFGGLSALLAMLNSCGSGLSVVNIDNGFGAGYQAAMINRLAIGDSDDRRE